MNKIIMNKYHFSRTYSFQVKITKIKSNLSLKKSKIWNHNFNRLKSHKILWIANSSSLTFPHSVKHQWKISKVLNFQKKNKSKPLITSHNLDSMDKAQWSAVSNKITKLRKSKFSKNKLKNLKIAYKQNFLSLRKQNQLF